MADSGGSLVMVVGRYAVFDELATGGMATVHIGRLLGEVGFSRTVAIKRLHPQYAKNPEFVSMMIDEARLAARIRHPNVVPSLDVVRTDEELFLVMEYVAGESLARLRTQASAFAIGIDPRITATIISGALHGLHAAHTATDQAGQPLQIVHRDVSPQNILVGTDGVARVFDFGIAKARGRLQTTETGVIKGKLPYMSPEQLDGPWVDARTDIYAASVVMWELLAGRRLFEAEYEARLVTMVLRGATEPPSRYNPSVPPALDQIVMRGLAHDPTQRFSTAREMAKALERSAPPVPASEVGEWVESLAHATLSERAQRVAMIESRSDIRASPEVPPPSSANPVREDPTQVEGSRNMVEPISQLSTISVAKDTPHGRKTTGLVVGAFITLAIAATLAVVMLDPDEAVPTSGAASVKADDAAATPAPESDSADTVAVAATSAASAPAPAEPSQSAPTSTSAPSKRKPAGPPSPKPPPPKADCDPPYRVNAKGIRIPKPECLR